MPVCRPLRDTIYIWAMHLLHMGSGLVRSDVEPPVPTTVQRRLCKDHLALMLIALPRPVTAPRARVVSAETFTPPCSPLHLPDWCTGSPA